MAAEPNKLFRIILPIGADDLRVAYSDQNGVFDVISCGYEELLSPEAFRGRVLEEHGLLFDAEPDGWRQEVWAAWLGPGDNRRPR